MNIGNILFYGTKANYYLNFMKMIAVAETFGEFNPSRQKKRYYLNRGEFKKLQIVHVLYNKINK